MGKIVEIKQITIGSVLEQDVVNAQGMVLLKRGITLEEKHGKILKRWGIKKVAVTEAAEAKFAAENPDEALLQEEKILDAHLDKTFESVGRDELMMTLKQTVRDFRISQLKSKYGQG